MSKTTPLADSTPRVAPDAERTRLLWNLFYMRQTYWRVLVQSASQETAPRSFVRDFARAVLRRSGPTDIPLTPPHYYDGKLWKLRTYVPTPIEQLQRVTVIRTRGSQVPTASLPHVGSMLRVDVVDIEEPIFSTTLNAIVESSSCDWFVVLRDDEHLHEHALEWLIGEGIARSADVVYADEDTSLAGQDHLEPTLRSSSIGPHTLWSTNAVGSPHVIRRSLWESLQGFDTAAGTAALHDFFVRAVAMDATFHHVAVVLAQRAFSARFAGLPTEDDAAGVVLRDWKRRGRTGNVTAGPRPGIVAWKLDPLTPLPDVEIVIPTRDRLELLTACLESITSLTTYPNYRITILDNDSRDADILAFFAATSHQVVPCPGPFNYAAIMNRGVAHTSAAFVVTLNNDTIVQTPDWLERMVAVAQLPEVGVVGTRQVDPDHGVVHAGVVLMPTPEHVRFADTSNYASMIGGMSRDVVAVTGACTMMRREVWDALGGLDETLRVVFNDIDLCLRSYELGYFTVYLDDVVLQHRESSSRGATVHHDDMGRFFARWDIFGSFRDPYAPAAMDLLDGQITAAFEIVPTNEQGFFYDKISES